MLKQLGKYEIIRILGQGAMGEVYLAHHPTIGRDVAIKTILRTATKGDDAEERFRREATAAGKLNHPNVVTIFDFDKEGELLYLVMEYVKGEDLEDIIEQQSMTQAQFLEVLAQVCDGLSYAHRFGVIHRDIKPSNIRVIRDGKRILAKVMDFGIARTKDSGMTATGIVMGTVSYMAPEYIQTGQATAQGDLWAIGVMLYECLAGRKPFGGDNTTTILFKIVSETPSPLEPEDIQGISPSVWSILERALSKEVSDRYQTAEELAKALRACKDPSWKGVVEATFQGRAPTAAYVPPAGRTLGAPPSRQSGPPMPQPGSQPGSQQGSQPDPDATYRVEVAPPDQRLSSPAIASQPGMMSSLPTMAVVPQARPDLSPSYPTVSMPGQMEAPLPPTGTNPQPSAVPAPNAAPIATPNAAPRDRPKSRAGLFVVAGILVLAIGGGGGYYWLSARKAPRTAEPVSPTPVTPVVPGIPATPVPAVVPPAIPAVTPSPTIAVPPPVTLPVHTTAIPVQTPNPPPPVKPVSPVVTPVVPRPQPVAPVPEPPKPEPPKPELPKPVEETPAQKLAKAVPLISSDPRQAVGILRGLASAQPGDQHVQGNYLAALYRTKNASEFDRVFSSAKASGLTVKALIGVPAFRSAISEESKLQRANSPDKVLSEETLKKITADL